MSTLVEVTHTLRYKHLVMWSLLKPGDVVSFKYINQVYTGKFIRMNKTIVWSNYVSQYGISLDIVWGKTEYNYHIDNQLLSEILFPGGGHATQPGVEYTQWSNQPMEKSFGVAFTCIDFPIILNMAIPNISAYDMVSWRSNWLCGIPDPRLAYEVKSDVQQMELWLKERREPERPPTPPPGLESPRQKRNSNKMPTNSELNKSDIKF